MAKKKTTKKKRTRRNQQPSVERRIMFYRVDCGRDDGGQPIAFDATQALTHIQGLEWDNNGRYQAFSDGDVVCAWVDRTEANQRMRFATVRRDGLPLVEDGSGTLTPLNIDDDAGLSEITQIVFFPDNILGAVFNFYGLRPTRLASYLKLKVPGTPIDLNVEPLIRTDITDELERFETIRVLDLKVRPAYAETVQRANESLGGAFTAAREAVNDDAEEIAITLSAGRRKHANLGQAIRNAVGTLLGRDDLQENAKRFVVSGLDRDTQRSATLDLLSDKLVSTKRIIKQSQRSRALNNDAAYTAIKEAYDELRDQLDAAAAVEVPD